MKKPAALGISRSGGARNPHVFQYTLRLLVSSLRLAPAGLARRFAPGEALLRSGGTRPSFAHDDFFTSSELGVSSGYGLCSQSSASAMLSHSCASAPLAGGRCARRYQ
ncbi:MAG: hypothetical protein ACREYE_07355 [Gammaproteobacteria bacterium]